MVGSSNNSLIISDLLKKMPQQTFLMLTKSLKKIPNTEKNIGYVSICTVLAGKKNTLNVVFFGLIEKCGKVRTFCDWNTQHVRF